MSDTFYQRGSASVALLLTSLFITSFGVGGQIAFSLPASTSHRTVQSGTLALAPNQIVRQRQLLTGNAGDLELVAPEPDVLAATDFLSEVTDPVTSTPSGTPQATIRLSQRLSSPKPSFLPKIKLSPTTRPSLKPDRSARSSPTSSPKVVVKALLSPSASVVNSPSSVPAKFSTPASSGSLSGAVILSLVNQHRVSIGKPAFITDDRICSIAQQRAPQVHDELYGGKKMHSGFYALNLPYWATENIAAYATEAQAVKWWLSDYIHKKAIESDAKYSCAACSGRYCSEIFTSFVSK